MFEEIRGVLVWGNKPMRIPDAQNANRSTWYIRAVWQRIGGVWKTNKQADVANTLGISLSTLKRYMTTESSCPYPVQFGLESLAGMSETGRVYRIEGALCNDMLPFAGSGSSPTVTHIALTNAELEMLTVLAKNNGLDLGSVSLMPTELGH